MAAQKCIIIYVIIIISATLLLLAGCQQYNADDFSDEPGFSNTVNQFNVAN